MAATLDRSGIQPPREGCLDPVITVDILDLSIEEKWNQQVAEGDQAPNGRCWFFDATCSAKKNL
jgi:hypothetical protein